jgi:hypothetical protein
MGINASDFFTTKFSTAHETTVVNMPLNLEFQKVQENYYISMASEKQLPLSTGSQAMNGALSETRNPSYPKPSNR